MRLLLDTCTFLWIVAGAKELSPRAREAFARYFEVFTYPSVAATDLDDISPEPDVDAPDRLVTEALVQLGSPWAPDTWILVTDSPAAPLLVEALHRSRKRAVLWAVDTPAVPLAVKTTWFGSRAPINSATPRRARSTMRLASSASAYPLRPFGPPMSR